MEKDDKLIDIKPNKQDIREILEWLKSYGDGFYNNKNVIEKAFGDGECIVLKKGKKNIGLVIWTDKDKKQVEIDIFVIHPDYRRQGLGRFYYNEISNYFRIKGFKTVKLFCEPKKSKLFWEKMGFIKLPDCGRTENELTYYTILVDIASKEKVNMIDKVELWNLEPDFIEGEKPKWTWYVKNKDGILEKPIIHPCKCDWYLRWSRNNKVIKDGKVKYFTNKNNELYSYPFMYIDELKE